MTRHPLYLTTTAHAVMASLAGLLLTALLQASGLAAQTAYPTQHAPLLGAAWYPEQWPEAAWDHDLSLMEQAHFNVVRIGEFAWSTEEPSEGNYHLAWLDRAIALAAKHHLAVVLGTPTDAPPAWLTTKYPQTLGTDADGHRREHGGRRQFNYADPLYRTLCERIVTRLATRFGHNPNVIGWQIGNEYTDESFDPATRRQFQQFLKTKYGTLANLNTRWSAAYWSQTYTDWSQIPLANTNENPGLLLEHKHFVTATWVSFQADQIGILRPCIDAKQFITTNIGGLAWSDNWDHYRMTEPLSLATWDDYVNPEPGGQHLNPPLNAMLNDFVRGWKRANFWVMETEPGSVNWAPVNNALAPGETRALAWQAIGHGADAILYWQWRGALNGQETYHGAVAGPDGEPDPIYAELQQLGADLDRTRKALAGTTPAPAEVALLHTYDSRWAIDFQPHTRLYDQEAVLLRFYKALSAPGRTLDVIDPTQDGPLSQYKLLVAPSLNVISQALAERLMAWLQAGGTLLLGPRSGMKDGYDALNSQRQPGPLAAALGAKVAQFYALDHTVGLSGPDVGSAAAGDIWAEQLEPTNGLAQVGLTYVDPGGWLDGKPALVSRPVGKGSIVYLGTLPDASALNDVVSRLCSEAQVMPGLPSIPDGVEVSLRSAGGRRLYIVINHNPAATMVRLPGTPQSLLPEVKLYTETGADREPAVSFTLPPEAVAVLLASAASAP